MTDLFHEEDLAQVLAGAQECHGTVVRDGELDACGKPATCIVDGRGTEAEGYWPACTWHGNRWGTHDGARVVPLTEILLAVR